MVKLKKSLAERKQEKSVFLGNWIPVDTLPSDVIVLSYREKYGREWSLVDFLV